MRWRRSWRGWKILARLEIDHATWAGLVTQLADTAAAWCDDAQRAVRREEAKLLTLRANALKGGAVNLGVLGLAAQFGAAEVALADGTQAPFSTYPGGLIDPVAGAEIGARTGRLRHEIARVRHAVATPAAEPTSPVAA
jgi:hypothetical protein